MACCAPCHKVSPSTTISNRRPPSALNSAKFISRPKAFVVTLAVASRQTCAAAHSNGNSSSPRQKNRVGGHIGRCVGTAVNADDARGLCCDRIKARFGSVTLGKRTSLQNFSWIDRQAFYCHPNFGSLVRDCPSVLSPKVESKPPKTNGREDVSFAVSRPPQFPMMRCKHCHTFASWCCAKPYVKSGLTLRSQKFGLVDAHIKRRSQVACVSPTCGMRSKRVSCSGDFTPCCSNGRDTSPLRTMASGFSTLAFLVKESIPGGMTPAIETCVFPWRSWIWECANSSSSRI